MKKCRVVKEAMLAGKRIRIFMRVFQAEQQFAFGITRGGWNWYTLFGAHSTVQECFESAIRLVRKHHPYAKVHEVA